ncbi:MAG: acyl-CoA thioesterase [Acidimicrobiales bacterium]
MADGGGRAAAEMLDELVRFLVPEPDGSGGYVGRPATFFDAEFLFGGFLVGQSLAAAALDAPEAMRVHSLHGYFLRAASTGEPITYGIEELKRGRTTVVRRVRAEQRGLVVFEGLLSLAADGPGYRYDLAAPASFPQLEAERAEPGLGPWVAVRLGPSKRAADGTMESTHRLWFRIPVDVPDDPVVHLALAGVASDWTGVGGRPLDLRDDMQGIVSLDHAVWFHRPPRADQWTSYDVQSLVNIGGRGTLRGVMRDPDGRVVASVAQEVLLKVL